MLNIASFVMVTCEAVHDRFGSSGRIEEQNRTDREQRRVSPLYSFIRHRMALARMMARFLSVTPQEARTYHLALSRTRLAGAMVKAPRHFLLSPHREDGVLDVARVLHMLLFHK